MTLPTEFLLYVAEILERLGIPYHVGGSIASSAHGMYRASADIDFVIDPTSIQLEALARALEPGFYVSRSAMAEALSSRSTFNAIHDETSFKIDFFISGPGTRVNSSWIMKVPSMLTHAHVGHTDGHRVRNPGRGTPTSPRSRANRASFVILDHTPFVLAWIHYELGDHDAMFASLERAYAVRAPLMAFLSQMRLFLLRQVGTDARYADLMRRMAFPPAG